MENTTNQIVKVREIFFQKNLGNVFIRCIFAPQRGIEQ